MSRRFFVRGIGRQFAFHRILIVGFILGGVVLWVIAVMNVMARTI